MNDIQELRKHLHQNPELSGLEVETAKTITHFLKVNAPDRLLQNLGNGTGIIAIYEPQNKVKRTIMFRCELDALPIQEINEFEHRSRIDEVSHKCGHDGHMSIICTLAKKLHAQRMKNTRVLLLFQPAEENGEGAVAIFNDDRFKQLNPDYVFALHNIPGAEMHDIIVKDHTFTCAVNSIIIKLHGKTAHAGEPFNGDNPAVAISEIIQKFQQKMQPDHTRSNYTIMTPIYVNMGTKDYGISAGFGDVHYTFRRTENSSMKDLEQELENIATQIAAFGLGSGLNTPALHNPDYDFPDEIAPTGAEIFYKISQLIDA